jgi:hypothetical protein
MKYRRKSKFILNKYFPVKFINNKIKKEKRKMKLLLFIIKINYIWKKLQLIEKKVFHKN